MFSSGTAKTLTTPIPCPRPTSRHALLALPSQGEWVRTARHFTSDLLRAWRIDEEGRDSAVLIVDELAVNAVQHGHADTTLVMALEDGVLLIAVVDSGACVAHHPAEEQDGFDPDEHGRGAPIVDALAHRVHIEFKEHGCQVSVALPVAATARDGQG
ncbi:ATP-binding protein [Streptomyces sp. NPDC059256]|uniref:ATP-binding protein n=1 Tax=Streptomyces sp. NPDC059256 TaxID=3346794 RepID=UPI003676AA60